MPLYDDMFAGIGEDNFNSGQGQSPEGADGVYRDQQFKLDWDGYWQRFKEMHGDPVEYGGRLLFADGYTYSRTDPSGPEWSPPTDPKKLLELQTFYWQSRLRVVKAEADLLEQLLNQLEEMQQGRSVPLQHHFAYKDWDEETGKQVIKQEVRDLVVDDYRKGRLQWLKRDVEECQAQLDNLTKPSKKSRRKASRPRLSPGGKSTRRSS